MSGPGPDEGAKMTADLLRIGFTKMKSRDRETWLNDVKNEDFTLQKVEMGTNVGIGDVVSLTPIEFERALVTPPKDLHTIWGMEDDTAGDVDSQVDGTSAVGNGDAGDGDESILSKEKEKKENKPKKKKKKIDSEDSNDEEDDYSKKMLDGSSDISTSSDEDVDD